jgi:ankyrin repeat protein
MLTALIKQLQESCTTGNLDLLLTVIYYYKDEAINLICGTTCMSPNESEESWDISRDFLHTAAIYGHLEIVKQLIEFGADVNRMSEELQTPLSEACVNGHSDIVRLLICKGAKVDPSNSNFEQSPIYLACCEGHVDILEILISQKPSLLQRSGQLLLYTAAMEGHLEVVKFLIKRRVDINPPKVQADIDGVQVMLDSLGSPLYGACLGNQIVVAQYLIENGATVTIKIVETFWEFLGEVLIR